VKAALWYTVSTQHYAHHVLAGSDGDRGPSRSDSQGRPDYSEFSSILIISVKDTNFHIELMGRPTVATGQQFKLKATVWYLGIMNH
jgi:hypothetical protein